MSFLGKMAFGLWRLPANKCNPTKMAANKLIYQIWGLLFMQDLTDVPSEAASSLRTELQKLEVGQEPEGSVGQAAVSLKHGDGKHHNHQKTIYGRWFSKLSFGDCGVVVMKMIYNGVW